MPQLTSTHAEIAALATPRVATARRVIAFDEQDVVARLFAQGYVPAEHAFMIVEQLARPLAETVTDVCSDGESLYVSVLACESNVFYEVGDHDQPPAGGGRNCVEVLLCPYGDGIGFLQFGAGPGEDRWFRHHWPYRDKRPHLGARPRWDVRWRCETMGEDLAWFTFFRFPLEAIVGAGYDGPLGFNLMRTQLATDECATWSHAGGSGFPDASDTGWLRLSEDTPMPDQRHWLCADPSVPGFQLQATYDWPDEMCGGFYTPEMLRREMRLMREHGVGRLYWIDYPFMLRSLDDSLPGGLGFYVGECKTHLRQTVESFGGELLPVASRIAHEEGLEFFTVIKPYDLWAHERRPVTDTACAGFPRTLGGYCATIDPFIAAHPEYAFRRNPAWTCPPGLRQVTGITLYADNDAPLPFDARAVTLYASQDNAAYAPCAGRIVDELVERPRYRWTPAGPVLDSGTETVRALRITDLDVTAAYFAVQLPSFTGASTFGNQGYLLADTMTPEGSVAVTLACAPRGDFRTAGFEFDYGTGSAGWSDASEGVELPLVFASGTALGIALGQDLYRLGMLDPGFPEVRRYWLDHYVQRAIDIGADGVDVRIAHHHQGSEWLSFLYAEPNLAVFRQRFGRDPEAAADDYAVLRRIRGEFHTQFLREAAGMLHRAGKKLEAHVESRMTTPPEYDVFTQIHWDYATWIDEGIVDGVSLKYLGPFNPFVQREILPRARRRGIPVHMIAAVGDPRFQARTPEYVEELLAMLHAGGLNGLNLYEVWTYLRTTPRGEAFARGCAMSVFERLARAGGA